MGHGHGMPTTGTTGSYLRPLAITGAIGAAFMALELLVGLFTSSLALLSDAAHLFADVFGTGMTLLAIVLGRRHRRSARHTFGLYRAEVLAALANAVLLFGVAGYVLVEGLNRLSHPPVVPAVPVMTAAGAGLLANVVCFVLLRNGAGQNLNVRGVYLEVLSDLVGAIGVLISGALMLLFDWRYADPIIGVAIGLFVLPRTWTLARRALRILFQHAPERLDIDSMGIELGRLPGVDGVHDLHAWTLTSGMEVVSAHLAVASGISSASVLYTAQSLLAQRYQIEHATLQLESPDLALNCHEMAW